MITRFIIATVISLGLGYLVSTFVRLVGIEEDKDI